MKNNINNLVVVNLLSLLKSEHKENRFYDRETCWVELWNKSNVSQIPFYAPKIVHPFITSILSDNHEKAEELSANGEILIMVIVSLL